jgi:hypothetical protein
VNPRTRAPGLVSEECARHLAAQEIAARVQQSQQRGAAQPASTVS